MLAGGLGRSLAGVSLANSAMRSNMEKDEMFRALSGESALG